MTLNAVQMEELSGLVDSLQALSPGERSAWLARLGHEHQRYRPALERLLETGIGATTDDFLATLPKLDRIADADVPGLGPGNEVGPYRLVRALGRGGMGEVWLAERVDGTLNRQVALKLPHSSLPQRQLTERFARERDILATLVHNNIARLYDAGVTAEGQPYLGLEYVEGRTITEWCDAKQLGLKARLALYTQVFAAVDYAHRQLVVHRDLKPSNILVTVAGEVRLLDFGIAKLLTEGQAQETELTRIGGRVLSLKYASPEQILGAPIGTASDVYALGVLLHELLTGTLPYRLGRDSQAALEDAILHTEPTRASAMDISAVLADARGGSPRQLRAALKGDLDTILQKALKKQPADRYASAGAFAEDLERFVRGAPVLAQADSAWYRGSKFVLRNRLAVAGAALVVASLATGLGFAVWQARAAQQEAQTAKAVQEFLLDIFRTNSVYQADPLRARQTTARELLDLGARRIDSALMDVPLSRFEVQGTLADMYVQLGLEEQAGALQQRRLVLARSLFRPDDPRLAEALLSLAETQHEGAGRTQVPALLREAFAVLDAAGQARSPIRASAVVQAMRYWNYESLAEARRSTDAAVAYLQQDEADRGRLATALFFEGIVHESAVDAAGAQPWFEKSISVAQLLGPAAPGLPVGPTRALGEALMSQWNFAEADTQLRAALALTLRVHGETHRNATLVRTALSNLWLTVGRTTEGLALQQQVRVALESKSAGLDQAGGAEQLGRRLAFTLLERGRPDLTVAPIRASIDTMRTAVPNASGLVRTELALAEALAELGQVDEAQRLVESATERWRRFAGDAPAPLAAAAFAVRRAAIELARQRPHEALALLEPAAPTSAPDSVRRDVLRARAWVMLGQPAKALSSADAALHAVLALPEGWRPVAVQAAALQVRGEALMAQGDAPEATKALEAALALRRAHDAPASRWHAQAALALANAWAARGRPDIARGLRAEAEELAAALRAANPPRPNSAS